MVALQIAVENANSTTGNTAFFAVENRETVGMIFKDNFLKTWQLHNYSRSTKINIS